RLNDEGCALVVACVPISPAPVSPDRALVEHRVPGAKLEAILKKGALSAGIDNHASPHFAWRALVELDSDADGSIAFKKPIEHARPFMSPNAVLAGVIEHHHVEFTANDLPGLRAVVGFVVPEIKGSRQLAPGIDKLDAVFLDEVAFLHLLQHSQPLEHPVGFRN